MTLANLKRIALALFVVGVPLGAIVDVLSDDLELTPEERAQVQVAADEALHAWNRDPATLRTRYISVFATNANIAAAADEIAAGFCHALTLDVRFAQRHADCLTSQRKNLIEGRPVCNLVDEVVRGRVALGLRLTEWQFDRVVENRTTPVTALLHNPDNGEAIVDVEAALAAASRRWCPDPP